MPMVGPTFKSLMTTKHFEMNGHAIIIWNNKTDVKPMITFDLKEVYLVSAVKGLPGIFFLLWSKKKKIK